MKRRIIDDKQTAAGRVRAALKERILDGTYPPGIQLRQDDIALNLGVSHIPVREALIQLASEGLVTFLPYRGAETVTLSRQEIREIYQVRSILETAAVRLAVPRLSPQVLNSLAEVLRQARLSDDPQRLRELHWQFHLGLYAEARNPRLLELIETQLRSMGRYLRIYIEEVADFREFELTHRQFLEACRQGDIDKAEDELKKDLQKACGDLCRSLAKQESEAAASEEHSAEPES